MKNIEPVAFQAQSTLRRRMHALENAHKKSSGESHRRNPTEETVLSHTDYESGSTSDDSSDGHPEYSPAIPEDVDEQADHDDNIAHIEAEENALHRSVSEERAESTGPKPHIPSYSLPRDRSWYEFDLTVVAALVPPIGNWLTGGDHVKNVVLVLLLLFYLHQIIEGSCYTLKFSYTSLTNCPDSSLVFIPQGSTSRTTTSYSFQPYFCRRTSSRIGVV